MLKRLPLNKRASDLAARAGFNPAPVFYGDVFLGRIQQRPQLQNRSFVLGVDTDFNTAAWLRTAVNDNLHYQQQINAATGQKDVVQAGVAGSDGQVQQEDGYSWTQTEGEIEVVVPLPADATSKQVKVAFRPLVLEVLYLAEPHVNLPLFERVDVDACTWTLDRSDNGGDNADNATKLVITMEKVEEAFWPRIRD
jgi:CS domain